MEKSIIRAASEARDGHGHAKFHPGQRFLHRPNLFSVGLLENRFTRLSAGSCASSWVKRVKALIFFLPYPDIQHPAAPQVPGRNNLSPGAKGNHEHQGQGDHNSFFIHVLLCFVENSY